MVIVDPRIRLASYNASDGIRVMIFGPIEADYRRLLAVVRELARCPNTVIELHRESFVHALDSTQLILESLPNSSSSWVMRLGVQRNDAEKSPSFRWTLRQHEWEELAERIGGLVASNRAGHQYLSQEPYDAAQIVLSKGEYRDDIVRSDLSM